MQVLLINNDGGGFADYIEIPDGTTVAQIFEQKVSNRPASDYLIRVNRQPCASQQILQEGDRISITPTKIEGALSRAYSEFICGGQPEQMHELQSFGVHATARKP